MGNTKVDTQEPKAKQRSQEVNGERGDVGVSIELSGATVVPEANGEPGGQKASGEQGGQVAKGAQGDVGEIVELSSATMSPEANGEPRGGRRQRARRAR